MGRNRGGGGRSEESKRAPERKPAEVSAKEVKKSLTNLTGYEVQYEVAKDKIENSKAYDIETSGNKITLSNGEEKREITVQGDLPKKQGVIDQRFKQYLNSLDGNETLQVKVNDNSLEVTEVTARTRFTSRFALLDRQEGYKKIGDENRNTRYEMRVPGAQQRGKALTENDTNFKRVERDNK